MAKFLLYMERTSAGPKHRSYSTCDGNHFLFSRRSRAEHMKSEKCQSCFFAPKIYALIHILQVKKSPPLETYVSRARPRDKVRRSKEINKSRIEKRSTCGKSSSREITRFLRYARLTRVPPKQLSFETLTCRWSRLSLKLNEFQYSNETNAYDLDPDKK